MYYEYLLIFNGSSGHTNVPQHYVMPVLFRKTDKKVRKLTEPTKISAFYNITPSSLADRYRLISGNSSEEWGSRFFWKS
jgi:hypothetical protein